MSSKTPITEYEATNDELSSFISAPDSIEPTASPKKKKNIFYRLLAFFLAIAPIAVFYFLETKVLSFDVVNGTFFVQEAKLLDVFLNLFTKEGYAVSKLFDLVPLLTTNSSIFGWVNSAMLYLIPVSIVVCFIASIVGLCSRKAGPSVLRFVIYVEFGVYAGYALSILLPFAFYGLNVMDTLDYAVLGIAGLSLVLYVIFSAIKSGKRAFVGLIVFLLTVASAGAIIYSLIVEAETARALFAEDALYKWITVGVVGFYAACVLIAFGSISAKKVYGADILRCILMFFVGGGILALSLLMEEFDGFFLYGIIAAAAALLMLIVESIAIGVRKKKSKKAADAEPDEKETVEEFVEDVYVEEAPVEAVAAPVAADDYVEEAPTVPVATDDYVEEAPVEAAAPVAVSDDYGSEFDAFIATLTAEERTQFTQIFLLRSENKLPEIPEYQIGGNNKIFFRKIFVNLGSVRARIPDGLMEKIYQFTIRQ